jgi:hypothetical protein
MRLLLLLICLISLISLNSFSDTKFHYGDRVKYTEDFYGICLGKIIDYNHKTKLYEVVVDCCNGETRLGDVAKSEWELSKQ